MTAAFTGLPLLAALALMVGLRWRASTRASPDGAWLSGSALAHLASATRDCSTSACSSRLAQWFTLA